MFGWFFGDPNTSNPKVFGFAPWVLLMPIIPIPLITCHSRSPCSSHWNCCCSHSLHLNKGNRPSNLHQAASCQGRCPVILPKRGGSLKGHLGHRSSDSTCFSCLMFFFLLSCLLFYHNVHPLSSMFHFFLFSSRSNGPTSSQRCCKFEPFRV